ETSDPLLKTLFSDLSGMELGHMETLSRRYHVPAPETATDALSPARVAVYAGTKLSGSGPEELLKLALHLEQRARTFFLENGTSFPAGSPEWKLYRELEAEEREHADLLATALARLRSGAPILAP